MLPANVMWLGIDSHHTTKIACLVARTPTVTASVQDCGSSVVSVAAEERKPSLCSLIFSFSCLEFRGRGSATPLPPTPSPLPPAVLTYHHIYFYCSLVAARSQAASSVLLLSCSHKNACVMNKCHKIPPQLTEAEAFLQSVKRHWAVSFD